jgi:hypothetical protein
MILRCPLRMKACCLLSAASCVLHQIRTILRRAKPGSIGKLMRQVAADLPHKCPSAHPAAPPAAATAGRNTRRCVPAATHPGK